jgi:DNA-directed RNA polymerase specialized sigma subunit
MLTTEQLQAIADDPRAFLSRNYRIEERIQTKRRRIEHLRAVVTATTQEIKAVVSYTGPSDKVSNCVDETLDLEKEIQGEIEALQQTQRDTAEAIELLVDDVNMKMLLELRYLACMHWEEIATEMNYALRWVMRLHKRALNTMRKEASALCPEIRS